MNSTVMNTIKAMIEHKKYSVITEYANVVHGKNNLFVSEYGGNNVRLYKDNDNNVRVLCPKNMDTVQEGYLAKAIADGSVFDDADDIDKNASVIERTSIPYDAMINVGKEPPKNLKPMIAIVVGRMGDDGSFSVTDADRTNGVNFVKDVTAANANGDSVNGVVDNYLEKDKEGFYTPDIGKNISGLNNELDDVNDTDPGDVVSDDDTVDSYDDYDMDEFERDPDAPDEEPSNPEEDGVNDVPPAVDPDDDSASDAEDDADETDKTEEVEECGDTNTVEECGNNCVPTTTTESDETGEETLSASMDNNEETEPVAPEEDPIATDVANGIIARYKRVSECGNNCVPTGKTVVQEDDIDNAETPSDPEIDTPTDSAVEPTTEPASDVVSEDGAPTEETTADGSVNKSPMPMSAETKTIANNQMHQEGFLTKRPKKLKPIGRDVVAYITCEMNDIHSANDQAMLAGYTCSKIELVDWYITVLDTQDPKYIVPHTRQYLVTIKAQLESLLAQILKIRPINRTDQIWRVNYPTV